MSAPATAELERIRVEREGAIARVILARPKVRNAFDPPMVRALTEAFAALGADPQARVIVLSGDGPVFSAGADLEYMQAAAGWSREENVADALRIADLYATISSCPKPVVVRAHGAAMGGGVGLVAVGDLTVAAAGTRFALTEVRLGLAPSVIMPYVLAKIGTGAARELFLTGEAFDAARAAAIGLVADVVPESELDGAVARRVRSILAGAPGAQAAAKRLLAALAGDPSRFRQVTADLIADRRASAEGREGVAAFLARREPRWRPE